MMYTTTTGPRYGGLTVVFFDHHGGDGEEQVAGTLTIPDYIRWGGEAEQQFTPEHVAIAMWNMTRALDDAGLTILGSCWAIVDEGEPLPTECAKDGCNRQHVPIGDAYAKLFSLRVDREARTLDTSPFPYPVPRTQ
jgi:hypothetical protein